MATRQFLVGLILTTDLAAHPEKDRSSYGISTSTGVLLFSAACSISLE